MRWEGAAKYPRSMRGCHIELQLTFANVLISISSQWPDQAVMIGRETLLQPVYHIYRYAQPVYPDHETKIHGVASP